MLQSISHVTMHMWLELHASMTKGCSATLGELFPHPGPSEPTRATVMRRRHLSWRHAWGRLPTRANAPPSWRPERRFEISVKQGAQSAQ